MATNLLRFKLTSLIGIRSYSTLNNGANTLIASRLNRTLTSLNGFGFQSVLKYSTFHQAAVNELVIADTGEWDVECDVAVVGSGGCGLVAAIAAAKVWVSISSFHFFFLLIFNSLMKSSFFRYLPFS